MWRELETNLHGSAPVPDPTCGGLGVKFLCATRLSTSLNSEILTHLFYEIYPYAGYKNGENSIK